MGGGTDYLQSIFLAHAGADGEADIIDGDYKIRVSAGSSHMSVTVFEGERTRRFTINPTGQHSPKIHPDSPHCKDQTALYVLGKFKPFWLTEAEVKADLFPHESKPNCPLKSSRELKVSGF